jgi:hypothetical protein
MGQYQQWLHYQEIDRHLRAQLEALEADLAQLQERQNLLEQEQPEQLTRLADNPIMQLLAANLNGHGTPPKSTTRKTGSSLKPGASISSALLSWGGLPNLGPQEMKETFPDAENAQLSASPPELELLPEDLATFFDENSQTDPQIELPWWLRNIAISTSHTQGNRPIDQQSIRTNRLVQRWIERWGRQPSTTFKPAETEEESAHE